MHEQKRNPLSDIGKICVMVDILCIVTYAKFGDNQLRGLEVAGGQILPSNWLWSSSLQSRTTVRAACVWYPNI